MQLTGKKLDAWMSVEQELASHWDSVVFQPDSPMVIEPTYDYDDWRWVVIRRDTKADESRVVLACEHLADVLAFWSAWTNEKPIVICDNSDILSIREEVSFYNDEILVYAREPR